MRSSAIRKYKKIIQTEANKHPDVKCDLLNMSIKNRRKYIKLHLEISIPIENEENFIISLTERKTSNSSKSHISFDSFEFTIEMPGTIEEKIKMNKLRRFVSTLLSQEKHVALALDILHAIETIRSHFRHWYTNYTNYTNKKISQENTCVVTNKVHQSSNMNSFYLFCGSILIAYALWIYVSKLLLD
jgi:hypothetical protein